MTSTESVEAGVSESDKVFSPDGFAVVMSVSDGEAILNPIRPGANSLTRASVSDLDVIDDEEWIQYSDIDSEVETPHR